MPLPPAPPIPSSTAPQQPLIAEILQRLSALHETIAKIENDSAMLRSRLFGQWPTQCIEAPKSGPDSCGADQIMAMIEAVHNTARLAADNVSGLEGKV